MADITYLRTWEGWLYLVAVQDLYSRRIVGWSMADHMRTELVSDALAMALARRRPDRGLIHHSDQGGQFVSLAFGKQACAAGIAQSMGSKGDCFDNAVAESFFATIKKELIHRRAWPSKAELRTEVFDYIEVFYNRERRHSTLGQRSPVDYENSTLSPSRPIDAASRLPSLPKITIMSRLSSGPGRLITPCPPKRGRSSLGRHGGWASSCRSHSRTLRLSRAGEPGNKNRTTRRPSGLIRDRSSENSTRSVSVATRKLELTRTPYSTRTSSTVAGSATSAASRSFETALGSG